MMRFLRLIVAVFAGFLGSCIWGEKNNISIDQDMAVDLSLIKDMACNVGAEGCPCSSQGQCNGGPGLWCQSGACKYAKTCKQLHEWNQNMKNTTAKIKPFDKVIDVFCEMENSFDSMSDSRGWTMVYKVSGGNDNLDVFKIWTGEEKVTNTLGLGIGYYRSELLNLSARELNPTFTEAIYYIPKSSMDRPAAWAKFRLDADTSNYSWFSTEKYNSSIYKEKANLKKDNTSALYCDYGTCMRRWAAYIANGDKCDNDQAIVVIVNNVKDREECKNYSNPNQGDMGMLTPLPLGVKILYADPNQQPPYFLTNAKLGDVFAVFFR